MFNEMKQYMGKTREYPHKNQIIVGLRQYAPVRMVFLVKKLCWISVMRCVAWDEQQKNKKKSSIKISSQHKLPKVVKLFLPTDEPNEIGRYNWINNDLFDDLNIE